MLEFVDLREECVCDNMVAFDIDYRYIDIPMYVFLMYEDFQGDRPKAEDEADVVCLLHVFVGIFLGRLNVFEAFFWDLEGSL